MPKGRVDCFESRLILRTRIRLSALVSGLHKLGQKFNGTALDTRPKSFAEEVAHVLADVESDLISKCCSAYGPAELFRELVELFRIDAFLQQAHDLAHHRAEASDHEEARAVLKYQIRTILV